MSSSKYSFFREYASFEAFLGFNKLEKDARVEELSLRFFSITR